ncbi:hypothetical protein TNCV_1955621 [Trichonephila clavipes]|nr:hypothetical protein TNCV_1955621 [Trichonephila clavipes]
MVNRVHDGVPASFCAPIRDWLDMAPPTLERIYGSRSMATMFIRSHTVGFFPMGPSQEIAVSRITDLLVIEV